MLDKHLSTARASALSGLALRQGLALVLFGWGYDFYFNPRYYGLLVAELTPHPAAPTALMALMLGLAGLLMTGLATRIAAGTAAGLFATLLVLQGGHQPIGLPQNIGLAGAAVALVFLGPGALALGRARSAPTPARRHWAETALRVGLFMTFLIYGIEKFTQMLEYRIVVAEVPVLAPVVAALGAERTVFALGVLEILLAFSLLVPRLVKLGAVGQGALLLGLIAGMGYPFSYPQDLGLLAALGAVGFIGLAARQSVTVVEPRAADRFGRASPQPVRQPVLAN